MDHTTPNIKSKLNIILDLPPSCLEFVPFSPNLFVVGTYFLEPNSADHELSTREGAQERTGSLSLYRLKNNEISLLQTISTPYAILDLHFSNSTPNTLAIATSIGAVSFYSCEIQVGSEGLLKHIFTENVADSTVLVLTLAWSLLPAWPSIIAVSLSNGQVGIFDYKLREAPVHLIHAHSLEAWTIAWSTIAGTDGLPRLYSGGDDSALSVHDAPSMLHIRMLDTEPATGYEHMSCDAKTHGAGVTAILPLMIESGRGREILVTGSYDEFLRVLLPKMPGRRTELLAEKRLYGGVWRLKLLDSSQIALDGGEKFKILVSCMHAGAKVVEVSYSAEEKWDIETLASFEEHESMNYASDAREEINDDNVKSTTYISTSFYDKRLCVWELKDD